MEIPQQRLIEKENVTDAIIEMSGEGEEDLDRAMDEAAKVVRERRITYPILVIPWGENSGADFHAVNTEEDLKDAVRTAMRASIHEKRVHLISVYRSGRKEQYKTGSYSGEGTVK